MSAPMARPLTLAVDLDLLLDLGPASGSPNDDACGALGLEPSFKYTVDARPSSASMPASPAARQTAAVTLSDSFAQQASEESSLTRSVWLRPGVRRFLLAIRPHFKTVLIVRRRCGARQQCCCDSGSGGAPRSCSADGSDRSCALNDGGICCAGSGAAARDWAGDVGCCSVALLAAALPAIDPDGQFFGQRIVLVQEQPLRPRTAQPKPSKASWRSGGGEAAAAPPPTSSSSAAAASGSAYTAAGESPPPPPSSPSSLFPVRVRDLSALPAALGERPSALLVATTADRSLFGGGGSLPEQVIECQPYRKEYGKYDDVLDCLATVVTGLLSEASVPCGLRRLGLLHSKLQPSPMMQALHAQRAMRLAQQHRPPPPPPSGQEQGQGRARAWQAGGQAAALQQGQRQQQQQPVATVSWGGTVAGCSVSRGSRRSAGGGGGGGGRGGESEGDGGGRPAPSADVSSSAGPISAGASTSPLPPIPELPLLEVGAEWPEDDEETEAVEQSPAAAAAAAPPPLVAAGPPSAGRSSAGTTCSTSSPSTATASQSQSRSLSSPPALSAASESSGGSGRPSRSSGSLSSRSNSGGGISGGGGAAAATPPSPLVGRRTAWDTTQASPPEGAGRPGLVAGVDSSAAAAMLQSLASPPEGAVGGGIGRWRASAGGDGGDENSLGWRPGSFPAASKPPVTRHISDCVAPPAGGAAAVASAAAAAVAAAAAPLPPHASPLSAAASAMAAATSRLMSRILGGRRRRRCRPSDVGEGGGGDGGGGVHFGVAASRTRSETGEGIFLAATGPPQPRTPSAPAAAAATLLFRTVPDRFDLVRQAMAPDEVGGTPSRSAAAAVATTSAVATPFSIPSYNDVSQASQAQPWAVPGMCVSSRPSLRRTTHSDDGCDAVPVAEAVAAAFPHRLSGIGRLSAAAAAPTSRDQPPAIGAASRRARSQRPTGQTELGEGPWEVGRGAGRCSAAAAAAAAAPVSAAGVPLAARGLLADSPVSGVTRSVEATALLRAVATAR